MRRFANQFPGLLGEALDLIGTLAESARVEGNSHIRVKRASERSSAPRVHRLRCRPPYVRS